MTIDFAALADCDLVIEAVYENMDVKKEIFTKLDATVKQGAILASNTSYLDIDEIIRAAKEALNLIDVQRVNSSYRMEQGFTFELNLSGVADEHRDAFAGTSKGAETA